MRKSGLKDGEQVGSWRMNENEGGKRTKEDNEGGGKQPRMTWMTRRMNWS